MRLNCGPSGQFLLKYAAPKTESRTEDIFILGVERRTRSLVIRIIPGPKKQVYFTIFRTRKHIRLQVRLQIVIGAIQAREVFIRQV